EKMLESALRKGDTINYDTAIWANVDHPRSRMIDVYGVGEGFQLRDILAGNLPRPYEWMESWMGPNPVLQYVEPHKDIGIIENISGVPFERDNWFGHKTDLEVHCSPRSVGKFLSMAETARQYWINSQNSKTTKSIRSRLESIGYDSSANITHVAGGFLSGNTLAGVVPEEGIFKVNPNFYDLAHETARERHMSVDDVIEWVLAHETAHLYVGTDKDTLEMEKEVDSLLRDFYAKRSEGRFRGYSIGVHGSEKRNSDSDKAKYAEKRVLELIDQLYSAREKGHATESLEEELEEALEETGETSEAKSEEVNELQSEESGEQPQESAEASSE
ncbi:hypothetical protein HY638_01940, partial [Candidatus Woesearchaeota archaeon]|nr:hypothetical protein [Candidatus Woesearchaeota archaeon]